MLSKLFVNSDAVAEGERFGLHLMKENPHLSNWLPIAYHVSSSEFKNPRGSVFEYNVVLNTVTKHTQFSKFISDLIYNYDIKNMPVRSILNGVGSTNIAAILFALYAVFLYLRLK